MVEHRSDDAKLALDLIAQLQDPKWALEQARIEEEVNCDISAAAILNLKIQLLLGGISSSRP